MNEQNAEKEMQKALFLNLAMMFSSAAMQQMGKLVNPSTGKTELNFEAAQFNIDLLVMLRAKAAGNMDREEEAFLNGTITSLQLTYVETAREQPGSQAHAENTGEPAAKQDSEPAAPPSAGADEKTPKFRKSYG